MDPVIGQLHNLATVELESGEALDVRRFEATDAMSRLFEVRVVAVSRNLDIDFDAVIGKPATFKLGTLLSQRTWRGVAVAIDQVKVDKDGLATYELTIAPRAYLLGLRKNYRIFQFKSELEIVTQLLGEWGVQHRVLADAAAHKQRKFRVQYGESDLAFVSRMLEDAGISYWFDGADGASTMVLDDQPTSRELGFPGLRFHDRPGVTDGDFVTEVSIAERVRPARRTVGDLDYRRAPTQQPILSAAQGLPQESKLEQYDYEPGAFLYVGGSGGNTPTADDRGTTRTDESQGNAVTRARHLGARSDAKRVHFVSNVTAIGPGLLLSIFDHPHPALGDATFLALSSRVFGEHSSEWRNEVEVASTATPYAPPRVTPKPRVHGLESATVVGASADEIHTDELARVRVHFHWDRESKRNEESSCWIPTNQPWAGAGFGGTVLPRIGQEVLVEFLAGDPDRPIVVGRVYTERQPAPYPLPLGKKLTGLVGRTTPSLVLGGAAEPWQLEGAERNGAPTRIPGDAHREFQAVRPKEFPKSNKDNAFLLDDTQNSNLVYLQAKKDLNFLVKHGWRTVVGNYRGCLVDHDDYLFVRNKQLVNVVADQKLRVESDQFIQVKLDREERVTGDIGLFVQNDATLASTGIVEAKSRSASIAIEAGLAIALTVGTSTIVIEKGYITVDAERLDVNP
ncbi:MAG TPA: type VI secretion system tip protein TssI/VgrG [Polyangiaceae bacterium]|nr:type VI secretion system tip protein TssI/VgrG [Polyangiaceae bacterium]